MPYFVPKHLVASLCLCIGVVFGAGAQADDATAGNAKADQAIRSSAEAFVAAFNSGDAKKIAALWTADGLLTDDAGRNLQGQKAIEAAYAEFFQAHPGAQLVVKIETLRFPAPNLAVEEGTGTVTLTKGEPSSGSHYTAIHAGKDGKWLMASVHETNIEPSNNSDRLQPLHWLIGKWQMKASGITATSTYHWIAGQSYLQREYEVDNNGKVISSGTQIIGWNPRVQRLCSWSFDSAGGCGTGVWTPLADGWQIESKGVLADGTPTSSRDQLIRVPGEDDVYGWSSAHRLAGNSVLADLPEKVLDRVENAP
jgi:uncharacterized protein (TIGR02246 family)